LQNVALLLSPIVPHICQALWAELCTNIDASKNDGSASHILSDHILDAQWPMPDETALVQDSIEYVVQVNGKLRGNLSVPREMEKSAIEQLAISQDFVTKFLVDGTSVRKIVVVPNKLVNVVIA
jgi:leucyl-tRNA synthetase